MKELVSVSYQLSQCGYTFVSQLWDDIATFRGEVKTIAQELIKSYNFTPTTAESRDAYQQQVRTNILALLAGSFFLRDGVDSQVSRVSCIQSPSFLFDTYYRVE